MIFKKIAFAPTTDVATNGTMTLAYPAGEGAATVAAGNVAQMYTGALGLLTQGASTFTVAYGGSIVVTYKGATTIPAGTQVDFWFPIPEYVVPGVEDAQAAPVALTDSSGGTAADTIAAIGGTYSQTEVRNAVASLAAKVNALRSILVKAGIAA